MVFDDNLNGRANLCLGSVIGLKIAGVAAVGETISGTLGAVVVVVAVSSQRRRCARARNSTARP
jgi:hypothetical protein